tara:strand:+ start:960 stop:1364 length:405 start_codon:yes stop_codon:yes gene_type:complete
MKDWLKKVTGFDKQEKKLASLKKEVEEEENKLLKKKDPKALATKKGEPWVNVLDVQVNKENIRNGFFELDWNKHFIEQLIKEGYGEEADPEEEIVDRWFRDIVYNMLQEEGLDTNRSAGYINVIPIDKGKSQVS